MIPSRPLFGNDYQLFMDLLNSMNYGCDYELQESLAQGLKDNAFSGGLGLGLHNVPLTSCS